MRKSNHLSLFKNVAQWSKILLQTSPLIITLFPDHFCKNEKEPPWFVLNLNFFHNGIKFSSQHFLFSSLCSQTTLSLRKCCINGVAEKGLLCVEWTLNPKLFRTNKQTDKRTFPTWVPWVPFNTYGSKEMC
jgi:hypothetical protein